MIRDFFLFIKFGKNIVENGEDVVCNVEFLWGSGFGDLGGGWGSGGGKGRDGDGDGNGDEDDVDGMEFI